MNPKLVRAFTIGAIAVGAVTMAQPSFAADNDKIVGVWKLVSYEVEVQATGKKGPVMGDHPTGYVTFIPEGRVFFVLTGEARKPAKTDQERAELLSTLVAYSGTYSVAALQATRGQPMSRWPGILSGSAPSKSGISR